MEPDCAPRLDTSHGFIKSIIKNQINRDEYHKFMEEKRQKTEKTLTEAAEQANNAQPVTNESEPRKRRSHTQPTQLYVPPHLRRAQNLGNSPSISAFLNSPKRNTFATNIIDNLEEENLREKARNRLKEQFAEQPSMSFSPSTSQNDNAARLAKELSRKHGYTDDQCRKLRETLDYELEKRLAEDFEEKPATARR